MFPDQMCVRAFVCVCAHFCGCRYKMHKHSEGEDVECPVFQDPFLWLLSSPCLLSGRSFSNLYAHFVYFCLPRVFGLVYILYTHAVHYSSLSRYLKTLHTGSSFIFLPSFICQVSLPVFSSLLSSPSFWYLLSSIQSWDVQQTFDFLTLCFLFHSLFLVFSLGYSCMVSTGSSWETLPDARLPVCWQRDNGGDRQGTTVQPPVAKASVDGIIIILWP